LPPRSAVNAGAETSASTRKIQILLIPTTHTAVIGQFYPVFSLLEAVSER